MNAAPVKCAAGLQFSAQDSSCKSASTDSSRPPERSDGHAIDNSAASLQSGERAYSKSLPQEFAEPKTFLAGPTSLSCGTAAQLDRSRQDSLSEAADQNVRCRSFSGNSQASSQSPFPEPGRKLSADSCNVKSSVGSTSIDAGKLRSLQATLKSFEECRLYQECVSGGCQCPQAQTAACSAGCCRPHPSQQTPFAGKAAICPGFDVHCQAHAQPSCTCSCHRHSQLQQHGRPYSTQHQPANHGHCVSAMSVRTALHQHLLQRPEAAYGCSLPGCQAGRHDHTYAHEQWPVMPTPGLSREPLLPAMPSCCSLPAARHEQLELAQPSAGSNSALCSCHSCLRMYAPVSLCMRDRGTSTFCQHPSDMRAAPEHDTRACEGTMPAFLPAACSSFLPELDRHSREASISGSAHKVALTASQ